MSNTWLVVKYTEREYVGRYDISVYVYPSYKSAMEDWGKVIAAAGYKRKETHLYYKPIGEGEYKGIRFVRAVLGEGIAIG